MTIENLLFRSCAELLAEEKVLCRMATAIFTNQIESGILRRGFFLGRAANLGGHLHKNCFKEKAKSSDECRQH